MAELLEREDLLAQLDAARAEGGRLVFVGGEAGVGKTALVRAFTAGVAGPVLLGSCENLTTPTPLGPLIDIGIPTEREPRHVAAALLRELERTRLLVLEDVHWADEATFDVLRVVGRRIDSTDALVLATYRDDEIDGSHPLRVVLGELTSALGVSRLSVPRLSLGAAVEARQAARELYHAHDDPLREGYALSRLTIAYIRLGRNAEAEEASRAAIQLLETLPPGRELACAYADQAYARMLSRDNAEGVAWGEKAVEAATALGDSDILAYGLNMIGTSHLMSGEIERGVEYLRRSLEVARTEGLEVWIVSALGMLGSGLGEMVELEQSERFLRECIAFSEAHEITPSYSQAWLALVQVYRGRWDEGTRLASALLARTPDPISRISALIALGRLRARRGDPGALDALDEALESARPGGHLQRLGHVHAARAEAAWLAGDAARTAEEAAAAYPLALEKRHLWFAGELAYWQWKAGELAEAPGWIAEPYRLQVAGDARAAASAWAARGCPYEAARALAEADDEALLLEALTRSNGWAPARPRRSSGRRCAPRVRPSHAGRAQRHGRTPRS